MKRHLRRSLVVALCAALFVTTPPAISSAESQIDESASAALAPSASLTALLAQVGTKPNPRPIPLLISDEVGQSNPGSAQRTAVKTVAEDDNQPTPPPPPPEPELRWEPDGATDYIYLTSGFLRYKRTPAAFILPNGERIGYEARGYSGLPQIPSRKEGSDVCVSRSEGKLIKAPTEVPDHCGGPLDRQDMMCHLSPYGVLVDDPLANYSYGTDWTVSVKYQIMRLHVDGVPTDTTRRGEPLNDEYAVKWGLCGDYLYPIPYKDSYECPIEYESLTVRGPYGEGLPTVNDFTGETIPESETTREPFDVPGQSPLGEAWNGGNLFGLGENARSIALVENCRNWNVDLPDASPDYYGNWDFTVRQKMTTCTIIRYPGYGQSSFQGCATPYIETPESYTKHVLCDAGRPQDPPIIEEGRNNSLSFTPEAMGCFSVTCSWNHPGLRRENGNGAEWPILRQEKDENATFDFGDEIIRAYADGVAWNFQYPRVRIETEAPVGSDATPIDKKWTVFEVNPGASPWNPRYPLSANEGQWFETNAESRRRVLSINPISDDSYCIPDLDSCLARGDVASVAPSKDAVTVQSENENFADDFSISFYRASRQGELFSVRALQQQRYEGDYALPSQLTIMAQNVFLDGRRTIRFVTISTCATGWTNFSVLNPWMSP